jgi:hypothetical protein
VFEKGLLFTAKAPRSQRELLLINPVRGWIDQKKSGLRPNYPQGSESFFLSVLSTERKNFSPLAFFAALWLKQIFKKLN